MIVYSLSLFYLFFFFFKQKTAYEMRISDWSSDVCSSDLVTARPLKPIIFQDREEIELQQITDTSSEHVIKTDEFLYGTRGRCNVGYGFWQMAFRSNAALTAENYEAAYKAIQTLR